MKKKVYGLAAVLTLLLGAACVSIARANHGDEYVAAAGAQSLYRLDVAQARGTIYDCGLVPLVGGELEYVAAVAPTIEAIGALETATQGRYRDRLAVALENGRPFQLTLDTPVEDPRVDVFQVPKRYRENQLAPHVIGYLDSLGNGAAGIELAMNDVLERYQGEVSLTYRVDAVGRAIAGEEPQVVNTLGETKGGVMLTLDSQLQELAQQAAQELDQGAVVITQVPGCEIRALASVPDFDPLDLGDAAQEEGAPLVNRAFSAYAPGSVFKLVAAAALLEEGLGDTTFTCVGSLNAGGLQFHCIDSTSHGTLDLEGALAKSCNCYFINAARVLGGQKVLSMAYNLGFGQAEEFGRGLWTASGELPSLEDLSSARALANFSFGQGELTATPLQVCAMMNAVASGGTYTSPKLIEGLVDENLEVTQVESSASQTMRVMKTATAKTLQKALIAGAEEGTGRPGAPEEGVVGIKTGTAQTGVYEGEEELLHFWYSGFVCDETGPRYCVTVLKESSPEDGGATARVFQEVARGLLLSLEEGN